MRKDQKPVDEQKPAEEQELFDVVLLKDHEHGGEIHLASSTIKVNAADKAWMLAQHIIENKTTAA